MKSAQCKKCGLPLSNPHYESWPLPWLAVGAIMAAGYVGWMGHVLGAW